MAAKPLTKPSALDRFGERVWVRIWPIFRPLAILDLMRRASAHMATDAAVSVNLPLRDRARAHAVARGWIVEMTDADRRDRILEYAALLLAQGRDGVAILSTHTTEPDRLFRRMATSFERLGIPLALLEADAAFPLNRATVGPLRRLAHDGLRDRILLDEPATPLRLATRALRGKPMKVPTERRTPAVLFAEADRALLDETRTAIAGGVALDQIFAPREGRKALELAATLTEGRDWVHAAQPALTALGRARVVAEQDEDLPVEPGRRAFLVNLALTAQHGLRRDHDYAIEDDALTVIDPATGQPDPGRSWTSGVQQMVELQNGLRPTPVRRSRAQINLGEVLEQMPLIGGVASDLDGAGREVHLVHGTPVWPARQRRRHRREFLRSDRALVARLERLAKSGAVIVTDRGHLADGLHSARRETAEQGLAETAGHLVLADATETRRTAVTLSDRNGGARVTECLSLDDPALVGWRWKLLRILWPLLPWRSARAGQVLDRQRARQARIAARHRAIQKDATTRRRRLLAFAGRI